MSIISIIEILLKIICVFILIKSLTKPDDEKTEKFYHMYLQWAGEDLNPSEHHPTVKSKRSKNSQIVCPADGSSHSYRPLQLC
jgi:hypothetical protein